MKKEIFKNKKTIFLLLAIIVAATGAFVLIKYYDQDPSEEQNTSELKDNKSTVEPQKVEFKILDEVAEISQEELLNTATWETYEHPHYTAKYPSEWYAVERSVDLDKKENPDDYTVYFSTNPSASAYDFDEDGNKTIYENWARVGLLIYDKNPNQTLEEWLEERGQVPAPGIDTKLQHVRIGQKTFLGTSRFVEISDKNAYFELDSNSILVVRIPSQAIGHPEAHRIYYTILSTLQNNK